MHEELLICVIIIGTNVFICYIIKSSAEMQAPNIPI